MAHPIGAIDEAPRSANRYLPKFFFAFALIMAALSVALVWQIVSKPHLKAGDIWHRDAFPHVEESRSNPSRPGGWAFALDSGVPPKGDWGDPGKGYLPDPEDRVLFLNYGACGLVVYLNSRDVVTCVYQGGT